MSIVDFRSTARKWAFFRAGGFDQVQITSGADLADLDKLDEKLWAAVACPVKGLHLDSATLGLIDTDKDGRIRVPEVIAAAKWACSMLKNPDTLLDHSATVELSNVNDATPEGKSILSSAQQILANLGKADAKAITADDSADTVRIFAQTKFNGDGVIPGDCSDDAVVNGVIANCMEIYGSVQDRSGKPGIDSGKLNTFFADLQGYADWYTKAHDGAATILPLGEKTADAYAATELVAHKIDDYFARSRLAAYDVRAQAAVNRQESEYLALAAKDMTITVEEVAGFPVAQVVAGRPLPLKKGLNPAWADRVAKYRELAVTPLLGDREELCEEDWRKVRSHFAGFAGWMGAKKGAAVEKLGITRIREILALGAKVKIEELIARDRALEPQANAIAAVDKLVRYHRDLCTLVQNFVNFRLFYSREKAVFQAGRLYLDQRACDLCVRVDDVAKHGALAPMSRLYLAYCDVVRKGGAEKMQIAAAFTAGDSDNLMVGRNGLFYDRDGKDWDATITKVFENPISLRQAFWSPYKKVLRWVEETIAKRAAAAEATSNQTLTSAAGTAIDSAGTGKAPPTKPKIDIGTVAAMGVAVGGITAAMGVMLQAFLGLGWAMPLGIIGLMLAISGPSMVIAWLKLRQRNLGPLLDANGWAVNTRARINLPFGATLTTQAHIPVGSKRDLRDPYYESQKAKGWTIAVIVFGLLLAGLWYFGAIERARNWWTGETPTAQTTPAEPATPATPVQPEQK